MKVLVLGSNGMAGHMIARYLSSNHNVFTAAKSNADYIFDATNEESVDNIIDYFEFDYVINCVGLLVAESNTRPDRAILINGWFPHYLSYKLQNKITRLIHLSTDCVFDGTEGPYTELSKHSEVNHYGKSKSIGEINNNKDVTFRMSIIGPELKDGVGLFNFIYKNPNLNLQGYENVWWNGITTLQLAKCIDNYISNPAFTGICHLVNNDVVINKYQLLSLINTTFELEKNVIKSKGPKDINKILIDTRNLWHSFIPDYETQLKELKEFIIT